MALRPDDQRPNCLCLDGSEKAEQGAGPRLSDPQLYHDSEPLWCLSLSWKIPRHNGVRHERFEFCVYLTNGSSQAVAELINVSIQ